MMPCEKCGSSERYKNGRCAPCTRESNQRWKVANRQQHREGSRRWAAQNPDACRAMSRRSARRHAPAAAERKQRWRAENPERHAAHEQARRARKAASGGTYTADEWLALCQSFGNRCLCCGAADVRLTVDHVVPLSRSGTNDISNIQPLCGPCNSAKGTNTTDYRTAWSQAAMPEQLNLLSYLEDAAA